MQPPLVCYFTKVLHFVSELKSFKYDFGWDEFLQVEELRLFAEALGVFYDLSSPGELIILMSSLSDYPNRDEILDAVNKLVTA